jgi:hypothetical protein
MKSPGDSSTVVSHRSTTAAWRPKGQAGPPPERPKGKSRRSDRVIRYIDASSTSRGSAPWSKAQIIRPALEGMLISKNKHGVPDLERLQNLKGIFLDQSSYSYVLIMRG